MVLCGGGAGTGIAWYVGWFADDGPYTTTPRPCELVEKAIVEKVIAKPEYNEVDMGIAGARGSQRLSCEAHFAPGNDDADRKAGRPVIDLSVSRYSYDRGPTDAVDVAKERFDSHKERGDSPAYLDGVGDDGYVATGTDDATGDPSVFAEFRLGNLVVTVEATVSSEVTPDGEESHDPPQDEVVAIATAAAQRLDALTK